MSRRAISLTEAPWSGLQDFNRDWDIAREIEDRQAGETASFTGRVRVLAQSGQLRWIEEGTLRNAAGSFAGTRCYLWRAHEQRQGALALHFEDGRFFHTILPAMTPSDTHDCPPDTYRVAYDFSDWPRWQATWHVTGPRKDYTMVSRYA